MPARFHTAGAGYGGPVTEEGKPAEVNAFIIGGSSGKDRA